MDVDLLGFYQKDPAHDPQHHRAEGAVEQIGRAGGQMQQLPPEQRTPQSDLPGLFCTVDCFFRSAFGGHPMEIVPPQHPAECRHRRSGSHGKQQKCRSVAAGSTAEPLQQRDAFQRTLPALRKFPQQLLQQRLDLLYPRIVSAKKDERQHHGHGIFVPEPPGSFGHDPPQKHTEHRRDPGQKQRGRQRAKHRPHRMRCAHRIDRHGRHPRQQHTGEIVRQQAQKPDGEDHPRRDRHRQQQVVVLGRE